MAITEAPPGDGNVVGDRQPAGAQGRAETAHVLATPFRLPRWRSHRTQELLRLAREADMLVWEKVRLRSLRNDLAAETRRRLVREPVVLAEEAGVHAGLELVDFERDSWPQ
jgi:hypothetical protein